MQKLKQYLYFLILCLHFSNFKLYILRSLYSFFYKTKRIVHVFYKFTFTLFYFKKIIFYNYYNFRYFFNSSRSKAVPTW